MTVQFIWPDAFITGNVNYPDTPEGKAEACADGIMACGIVMAGNTLTPEFGNAMAKISAFLGVSGEAESLMEYSKTLDIFKEQ